ncbi:MAG: hypothetical protein COB02_03795 [Candidatus Cloacimonadota bacterium]|nr:MAG: hypothetical protein COB02_03795 [Candidatus Cloacimonadota bacterium]
MNLSISNFRNIKLILFQFFVFFSIYNLLLFYKSPTITSYQSQWQQNYSIAQKFIYNLTKANVIVGSSLAARMRNRFLDKNLYNLSFSGGSVLTGLEIIKQSNTIPKYIFIEINTIFREQDIKMLNSLYYPIWSKVKRYLPALIEKNQPLNLILSKLKNLYGKSHINHLKEARNQRNFEMSLKLKKLEFQIENNDLKDKLIKLKLLINYLELKGAIILFFEMPIEKSLVNSIKMKQIRKVLQENFSNKNLLISYMNYTTSDGLHLLYKDAYEYTKKFKKSVNQYEKILRVN